jgi:hypothetical protein
MNTAALIVWNILMSSGLKVDHKWVDDHCRMANMTPEEYLLHLQELDSEIASRDLDAERAAVEAFERSFPSMSPADRAGYEAARERQHMPCSVAEAIALGYIDRAGNWIDDPAERDRRVIEISKGM